MLNGRKATKELLKAMEQAEKPVTNADRIRTVSDDELIARRLIELLKEVQDYGKYQRGAGLYSIRNEIVADHLIANGVTVQEWIPVTEPPTKQGWYHVAIKDLKTGKYRVENDLYAIETAIAHGHSVGFCKEKAWPERDKLTHWCYYPEPPKGD